MASFWSFSTIFIAFIACNCSLTLASVKNMHVSAISAAPTTLPEISAAPTILPEAPIFSPAMSPDMEPLFPTPGRAAFSPSDSSLPTIPSSPSPPNPDISTQQGPALSFPPSESISPAIAPSSQGASLSLFSILHLAIMLICIIQLHGM
jgi:hypothetical protein